MQNCPLRTRSSKHAHSRSFDKQRQHREEQRRRWRERADNQPFNPSDTGKRKRDDEADVKIEYTKGLILKLNTDDTTLTREDIKTEVMKYGKAAFVDFHSGSTEGYVRMQTPEMSNAVVAAMARVDVDASAPAAEAPAAEAPASESAAEDTTAAKAEGAATDGAPAPVPEASDDVEQKARFSVVVLGGDEEEAYWRKIKAHQKAAFRNRARGGGGGHGNRH